MFGTVSADDIGKVGKVCLSSETALDFRHSRSTGARSVVLTGPSSLSYDEIAALISAYARREITHVKLEPTELAKRFTTFGLYADYAEFLAQLDTFLASGSEARTTNAVQELTGRPPRSFADFVSIHAHFWRGD